MCFFFFKQTTAYELRISDWSSDVCSSDLREHFDLRPYGISKMLDLIHLMYQLTASYGHFGRKPFEHTYKWKDIVDGKEVVKSDTHTAFTWEKTDRKSVVKGKSVSVRVDMGGRRCMKKNKKKNK